MKMAFSSNQEKTNLHVQHAFLSFPCRYFARLQRRFVRLRPCLHGVGDPGLVGQVSFVLCPQSVKTKETNPTRPGSPTPCKQGLKRQTSQLHILFMEELSYVVTQYGVSCVPVHFYFSLLLIFILLAASISHFLSFLNFHVFLPTKFVSYVFNNSLQLFLLSTLV